MGRSRASSTPASGTCEWTSRSVEETQRFGRALGASLDAGDVVGFIGELGTGKTTLIQALAQELGVDPRQVKSPTFVLAREYAGRWPVTHLDGYRLEGESSVVWLDLDWMFGSRKVTLIEWADRFEGCLPEDWLEVRLSHASAHHRAIQARAHGPRAAARLAAWQAAIAQLAPAEPDAAETTEQGPAADEPARD